MDKTRMAFEQWWGDRVASHDAKMGAWAAWLYLTGNDTLAKQQERYTTGIAKQIEDGAPGDSQANR